MSSYKKHLLIILTTFLFVGCAATKQQKIGIDEKILENEDQLIVYALEYERKRFLDKSVTLYLELFYKTNRYIYLTRALNLLLEQKKYNQSLQLAKENITNETSSEYENIMRIYVVSLINLKQYDLALTNALKLLEKNNSSNNYELIANIYYQQKNYKKSVEYFESSYVTNFKSKTLLNLVNILYVYLDQKEKALSYLETHIRLYGDELVINYKLLSIYQEQKNLDGIISILKRIYYKYKDDENTTSMEKTSEILVSYLEKKDIKLAIKFLEKENNSLQRLLALYKKTRQIDKALMVIMNIYKQSGNIDLLAQVAVLEFESAKDKRKVIPSVIKKFEEVLTVLNNHIYQNYLGYILIDFDIDVKKGLIYVNKALEKAPNNVAYIDSLAWGEYKLNNCEVAYTHMKKVVDAIGLNDEEIKDHWNKIKECGK
ncbi:hypothetical protein A9Q76_04645 [Arcobacter sp. 31_11_sub10_T18]|nr:hypothetical protein A9Q76_04645 [Arcobacter sp. 31_11_sub10_T18]